MKRVQRVFGDLDALRFVDNRLDDERRAAFAAHLAEDVDEAERVAMWHRQNDAIRAAFASVAAEPVPVSLRLGNMAGERPVPEEIDHARGAEPLRIADFAPSAPQGRRDLRIRSLGVGAAVLIAAGLMVLVLTRGLMPALMPPGPTRAATSGLLNHAFLLRATDAFRTFALDPVHPVEIASTQQPQLERWLQHRLSIPLKAPDLRDQGWSLLGGRLAPGDFGPAAFFVFENETNARMGLYVARTGAAPDDAASVEPMPGGSTLAWIDGPVGFVLVADKDVDWMNRNADALKAKAARAVGD